MATPQTTKPIIGILCNNTAPLCDRWLTPFKTRDIDVHIIKPRMNINAAETLDGLDGLLLPGGDSNIHPSFVGRDPNPSPDDHDIIRDFTAIALIREAHKRNLPTLGICRGMQEMVAAYGGALQKLDSDIHASGYDHRGDFVAMDQEVHKITFEQDGQLFPIFRHLCDNQGRLGVNSIHYEGITEEGWNSAQSKRLRDVFQIEAQCPDDKVIEAISAINRDFFIGVQAHFEFKGELHEALFGEFKRHIDGHHEKQSTPKTQATPDALPS